MIALLVAVLLALGARTAAADCGCSGNPGTVTSDATGPCIRYAAPSGAVSDVVFRLGAAYACGSYANGDLFVVVDSSGHATLTAITPDGIAGRHGVDVNPSPTGPQRWDDRLGGYAAPVVTYPYAASAGQSVVKYVSDTPAGACVAGSSKKSCGRFAAVLTVLAAAPAAPATTFRPPFVGTYKPELSTIDLQVQLLSELPSSCCADKLDAASAALWTRHLRLDYTDNTVYCDTVTPADATPNGSSWSTDIWRGDTEILEWLLLDGACGHAGCTPADEENAKLPVLIGYVQHGIDVWGTSRTGSSFFRGGGGNGGGKLMTYVFAAAMLNSAELRADLVASDSKAFFESGSYYRGQNGVALWGQLTGSVTEYWSDLASPPGSTKTIRDPYGYIDGGSVPGSLYQDNTVMPTKYTALLMRLVPGMRDAWPHDGSVILDYADRWVTQGAWTQPDPCAPPVGTYGVDYGPDGSGGCIHDGTAPYGRVPALHGTNVDNGNRKDAFGQEMWTAFRVCADACGCMGQVCGPAVTDGGGTKADAAATGDSAARADGATVGPDGTTGGAGGGVADGQASSDASGESGVPSEDTGGSCGCRAAGARSGGAWAALGVLVVLGAMRRRASGHPCAVTVKEPAPRPARGPAPPRSV